MLTIGNCFFCDLVKLICLTLLFVGVAPHTGARWRTKESAILKTSMGHLLSQINMTLDALNVIQHHCKNNEKVHFSGIIRYPRIKPLYKRPNTSMEIRGYFKEYEIGLTAYRNTFQHVLNANPTETHVPRREELERIIVDTSLIRMEWNALFYDTRLTPNSEHKKILCKRKKTSGSELCLCVSTQIDRYRRFLVAMYRRLRKLSIRRLRQLLQILNSTSDKNLFYPSSRRFFMKT